jgi:hypothetical protein
MEHVMAIDLEFSKKQLDAVDFVADYRSDPGPNLWPHVHPNELADELEQRIHDPNSIAQRHSPWCGPAAVCRSLAADAPKVYAHMIINLVRFGRATVHHGELASNTFHTNAEMRAYPFQKVKIAAADWVPLVTLRASARHAGKHPLKWLYHHGTKPDDIVRFYQTLGYSKIHDQTSEFPLQALDAFELVNRTNHRLGHHYRVTLRINADMLAPDDEQENASLPGAFATHNHWVDLLSPIVVHGSPQNPKSPVSLKVFSWGKGETGAAWMGFRILEASNLTFEEFASDFFGFVCAKY